MGKDLIEKKERNWTALTVINAVKARLDKLKQRREQEIQMKMSWSDFLQFAASEMEKLASNGKHK